MRSYFSHWYLCVACSFLLQLSFSILKSEISLKNLGDLPALARGKLPGLEEWCPFPVGLSTLPSSG